MNNPRFVNLGRETTVNYHRSLDMSGRTDHHKFKNLSGITKSSHI